MSLYNLLDTDAEYAAKMYHPVPGADVVDRARYLLSQAKGRCVVDIGASGPMSEAIQRVAGKYHSINIANAEYCVDLDKADSLPDIPGAEVVIAGEVIEHLSNAGHFLALLKVYACPVILTAPNAFSKAGRRQIDRGIEAVNPEHVAWYSYTTLSELLRRYDYKVLEWHWYNGQPWIAEGLIFRVESEVCQSL